MARFANIRDRLPSLYRPQPGDNGLVSQLVRGVSDRLDELNATASDVLQSHWFAYADRALHDPHFNRSRQLLGLTQPRVTDLVDIIGPPGVAVKLRDGTDPVSAHLRAELSNAAVAAVDAYEDTQPVSSELQRIILDELNRLLTAGPLFEAARFAGVSLADDTQQLLDSNPQGSELVRLNTLLLQDAFPEQIAASVLDAPFIHDLGRLASLLSLSPWTDPPTIRESVEAYRLRVRRIVALYRNGLATTSALRAIVEAQLPTDLSTGPRLRDRPFWLEEFAPLATTARPIQARGQPTEMVGPLMRWSLNNEGIESAVPTIYIQGVVPSAGSIDPTLNPVIELFEHNGQRERVGIAYDGLLEPGQTLRLSPMALSWLGSDLGVSRAQAMSSAKNSPDPTAPGPWQAEAGGPPGEVVGLVQTRDRALWAAANVAGDGQLWRYDGQTWNAAVTGLSTLNCLVEDADELLLGTAAGMSRVPLYPDDGLLVASSVASLAGQAVFAVMRSAGGPLLVGTENGAFVLNEDASTQPQLLQGTPVNSIAQDQTGTLYFGGPLGLFQHQASVDRWYWFSGEHFTEQQPEWLTFNGTLPTDNQVFLPGVLCVHRGPDASLWIGTTSGIARYLAASPRGTSFQTLIEAFPDLTGSSVFDIQQDARGLIWFCTADGLFRFDGRDWWQYKTDDWVALGRADTMYKSPAEPRGAWRFERNITAWRLFAGQSDATVDPAVPPRSTAEGVVRTVIWTDGVVADIGQWDGESFTGDAEIEAGPVRVRYKPSETRIVDGGLPAAPRLPVGVSTWRYLAIPQGPSPEPNSKPAWTSEGRLLPPPPNAQPAAPGRYDITTPPPPCDFDEAVFAFCPAARVWFEWEARRPLTVLARLKKRSPDEHIDPAIIDRVFQGIEQVRPAGVRAMLAVEEQILRGKES